MIRVLKYATFLHALLHRLFNGVFWLRSNPGRRKFSCLRSAVELLVEFGPDLECVFTAMNDGLFELRSGEQKPVRAFTLYERKSCRHPPCVYQKNGENAEKDLQIARKRKRRC